jgi:hypothetical protein
VHRHRKRRELLRCLDEARNIGGLGDIADDMGDLGAGGSKLRGGRRQLLRIAARDYDRVAARGEPARDCRAHPLGCADAGDEHAALRRRRFENG